MAPASVGALVIVPLFVELNSALRQVFFRHKPRSGGSGRIASGDWFPGSKPGLLNLPPRDAEAGQNP